MQLSATTKYLSANGLVAINKPSGWSSAKVVAKVRAALEGAARRNKEAKKPKIKVGHGGTLDPMATGVLVLGIGSGCRQLENYLSGAKKYRAEAILGTETDTLDSEGKVLETAHWDHVDQESLEAALNDFRGDIMQIPPMYSALKKDGKRLYELARSGVTIERPPRPVHIAHLELISFDRPSGSFSLEVECGGGTYIRSLISDIARHDSVRSLAHMTRLERTQQGPFSLADCISVDEETERICPDTVLQYLLSPAATPTSSTTAAATVAGR